MSVCLLSLIICLYKQVYLVVSLFVFYSLCVCFSFFFSTQIEEMINEVKFSEYVTSGQQLKAINLGELIKCECW